MNKFFFTLLVHVHMVVKLHITLAWLHAKVGLKVRVHVHVHVHV